MAGIRAPGARLAASAAEPDLTLPEPLSLPSLWPDRRRRSHWDPRQRRDVAGAVWPCARLKSRGQLPDKAEGRLLGISGQFLPQGHRLFHPLSVHPSIQHRPLHAPYACRGASLTPDLSTHTCPVLLIVLVPEASSEPALSRGCCVFPSGPKNVKLICTEGTRRGGLLPQTKAGVLRGTVAPWEAAEQDGQGWVQSSAAPSNQTLPTAGAAAAAGQLLHRWREEEKLK